MQPKQLQNATVLITGASKGIGRAIAQQLSGRCRQLIAVGRDPDGLSSLSAGSPRKNIRTVQGDICDAKAREAILCEVQKTGGLDVLINNAGSSLFSMLPEQKEHDIRALMETNLIAPILLTQVLLPELSKRPSAEIIQIGSTFSQLGHPGYATYCASKAGLRLFSQALDRELADSNVRVRTFSPRATQTGINSNAAVAFMETTGQKLDSPEAVGQLFCQFLESNRQEFQVGLPERFFVWLNHAFPDVVRGALVQKLAAMRRQLGVGLQ